MTCKKTKLITRVLLNTGEIMTVGHRTFVRAFIHCGRPFLLVGRHNGKRAVDLVSSSGSKAAKRQVTKTTFKKWQRQFDCEHQTLSWLHCDLDRVKVHVATLWCEACKKHEHSVQSLKNFSRVWITGSTNQKVSNVVDHATSEVHKASIT